MIARPAARLCVAILAAALAGGLGACGGGSSSTHSATVSSAWTGALGSSKRDRDDDHDKNDDDAGLLAFGHVPSATETRTITTLVQRYFAAAAAGSGTRACSMLAPFVAESVAERNGAALGVRGDSCGPVMTKLFRVHRHELRAKQPTMKVLRVGVAGSRSLVALEFPAIEEDRETTARRIDGRWRIINLLDDIME